MRVYRFEFMRDSVKQGFLVAVTDKFENYFTVDEFFKYFGIFEVKLALPNIDMQNTKSYFTEKGYRKFRKMIKKIEKLAADKGICFLKEEMNKEELKDILFEDENQVIIRDTNVA